MSQQRARVRSYTTLAKGNTPFTNGKQNRPGGQPDVEDAVLETNPTVETKPTPVLTSQNSGGATFPAKKHRLHGIYPLLLSQLPELEESNAHEKSVTESEMECSKASTILGNSIEQCPEFTKLGNEAEGGRNDSSEGNRTAADAVLLRCRCSEEYLSANFCQSQDGLENPAHPQPTLDFHERFAECTACKKKPAAYLCTSSWSAFCPEHAKTHFTANPAHHIMCRYELWQYEECFWCFKCRGFAQCEYFDAVLEPLFVTKGSFMPRLISEKHSEYFSSEQFKCGATTVQGWRTDNEDAHIVSLRMPKSAAALFAVFDGHGGPLVARAAAQLLGDMIDDLLPEFGTTPPTATEGEKGGDIYTAVPTLEMDGLEPRHGVAGVISKAMITVDEKLEKHFNNDQAGTTGSTANVVLLLPDAASERSGGTNGDATTVTYSRVLCANCGDSRAVIGLKDGTAKPLSVDQRPTDQKERMRVEAAGGTVVGDRVEGLLAVSRALGDYDFKQNCRPSYLQPVTALPEVTEHTLNGAESFIIVACDGIWDVVSSDEAVEFVSEQLLRNGNNAVLAAEALIDRCLAPEMREDGVGMDNMSVIITLLS